MISDKTLGRIVKVSPFLCLFGAWMSDIYPKYEWQILAVMIVFVVGLAIVIITRTQFGKEPIDEDHLP